MRGLLRGLRRTNMSFLRGLVPAQRSVQLQLIVLVCLYCESFWHLDCSYRFGVAAKTREPYGRYQHALIKLGTNS